MYLYQNLLNNYANSEVRSDCAAAHSGHSLHFLQTAWQIYKNLYTNTVGVEWLR